MDAIIINQFLKAEQTIEVFEECKISEIKVRKTNNVRPILSKAYIYEPRLVQGSLCYSY